jgi:NAD(P)H-nitrite reductase large subunit
MAKEVVDREICHCKHVNYSDVDAALHNMNHFDNVVTAFDEVQKQTQCSTGCGKCHDAIMDTISEIMMG